MCDSCVTFKGRKYHRKAGGYYTTTLRLHREVWEEAFGKIPEGSHVHHRNEDKSDNRIENLQLLTRSEHAKLHAEEKLAPYREAALIQARHVSEERRLERLRRVLVCKNCGDKYHSGSAHPRRFCSSKCIEAARSTKFGSGKRHCEFCGKVYQPSRRVQRYCSKACCNAAHHERAARSRSRTCVRPLRAHFDSKRANARFCRRACAVTYHGRHQKRGKISEA